MYTSKKLVVASALSLLTLLFAAAALAQPPPPPPPAPTASTPPPVGNPPVSWACPDTTKNICCNATIDTDGSLCASACGQACNPGSISCWAGATCSAPQGCPGSVPTCKTDPDCGGGNFICINGCCGFNTSGQGTIFQCQNPNATPPTFGKCFQGTDVNDAQGKCISECEGIGAGTCVKCPAGAACFNGANCVGSNVPPGPGGNLPPQQPKPPIPIRRSDATKLTEGPGIGGLDFSKLKPGNFTDFLSLLSCIFSYLVYFAIPIAVVVFALAGVLFLASRGEPEKTGTAKKMLTWGVVGFIIVLLAKGILAAILAFLGSGTVTFACSLFS